MSKLTSTAMTDSERFNNVESIELLIRQTISQRMCIDINEVQPDTFFDDLKMDSLDLAELIFLLEGQLHREINIGQITKLKTIGEMVTLLNLPTSAE